jgi:hypothetical protein
VQRRRKDNGAHPLEAAGAEAKAGAIPRLFAATPLSGAAPAGRPAGHDPEKLALGLDPAAEAGFSEKIMHK